MGRLIISIETIIFIIGLALLSLIELAYPADERHVFESAKLFAQTEGWLPAPESAYSICCAIDEALKCRESGDKKTIAFNFSGHGFLDIPGYRSMLGT